MCSHMRNALRLRRSNGAGHHVPHPPGQNLPHQEPRGRHWPRPGPVESEYTALHSIYFIFYLQKHKGWPTRRVLVIFYDNFTKPLCKKSLTNCFNFSFFLLLRFECVSRRRHKIMIRPQRSPYVSFFVVGPCIDLDSIIAYQWKLRSIRKVQDARRWFNETTGRFVAKGKAGLGLISNSVWIKAQLEVATDSMGSCEQIGLWGHLHKKGEIAETRGWGSSFRQMSNGPRWEISWDTIFDDNHPNLLTA